MVVKRIKKGLQTSKYIIYRETLIDYKEFVWSFIGAIVCECEPSEMINRNDLYASKLDYIDFFSNYIKPSFENDDKTWIPYELLRELNITDGLMRLIELLDLDNIR